MGVRTKMKNGYHQGHFLEKVACFFLLLKGYLPVKMNFVPKRSKGAGEIDLIMRKGNTIVFVEVKKRKTFDEAADALSVKQRMRIVKGSQAFLRDYPEYKDCYIRYDTIWFIPKRWPIHICDSFRVL